MIARTLLSSLGEGAPEPLAPAVTGHADWHQAANLAQHGCSPRLALRIVC